MPENNIADHVVEFKEFFDEVEQAEIERPAEGVIDSSQCFIYRGYVEKLHPNFLENGLVKVRIPMLHFDTDISNIPYAQVTQTLLSWCNSWQTPKTNNNNMSLHAKGTGSIDGNLELKSMYDPSGYLVANATISQSPSPFGQVGFGTPASGPITNKGGSKIDGNTEIDVETDDFDKCEITPKEYELRPYNFHRKGENLLRNGDQVLVVAIMGYIRDLVVVDIIKFKSDEQ
jgi:hypothetical protein